MVNPFDDEEKQFLVVVNEEEQHSLWPAHFDIPAGWVRKFGPEARQACLTYVNQSWTDMRPKSLVEKMREADQAFG